MTVVGASAAVTAATKTIEGTRGCRIAISPRFDPMTITPELSPLYGTGNRAR
jgi:hypothetical protein